MPWIAKLDDRCPASRPYGVVKTQDNELEGCHETQAEAMDQVQALFAAEAERSAPPPREVRLYPFADVEVREDDGKLRMEGYAAVFDSLSEDLGFREKVAPGAFRRTLRSRPDVRLLVNHDPNLILARTKNKTLSLEEDDKGLHVEAEMAPTTYAQDLAVLLRRRDVDQMSFGFQVVRDAWEDGEDGARIRTLREVRLFDTSVVTFPAYEETLAELRAVSGATDLPLAPREREWDADAAEGRVRSWSDSEDAPSARYRQAFFWFDSENPDQFTAYKLGFADVIDGRLTAVPRGIFAVAAVLSGARGGVDIPASDAAGVRSRVETYYGRMREAFEDESIVVPWERAKTYESLETFTPEEARQAIRILRQRIPASLSRERARVDLLKLVR